MTTPNGSGLSFAIVDISSLGDNIVIPAVDNKSIFVNRVVVVPATDAAVQFKAGSRLLSGPQVVDLILLDYSEQAWYVCNPGEDFIINLGTSVQTGGTIWFQYGP